MRTRTVIILSVLGIAGALATAAWAHYRWTFPYGRSHSCILAVMLALESYAKEHDGHYPGGETSAEASLSLLHRSGDLDPGTLRGMTIPEGVTRSVLEGGGLLSPESCGWHYVDGLTRADDRELALLWCKEPLGHNGDRSRDGGRQVGFLGGEVRWISGARWTAFLEDQTRRLAQRGPRALAGAPLVTGSIVLPDGMRIDHLDCACTIIESSKGAHFSSSGTYSGCLDLVWYHAPFQEGQVTRTLSFSNLTSDPVTVGFTNGVPDATNVVFRMRPAR
ncbi:MAG: hypothetical protein IT577_13875 [Verrucomicrobiae bacterium]|nr:hypothetical protein [Verrucomicrobiae bacterium]